MDTTATANAVRTTSTTHKTYKYKLKPTPVQQQKVDMVVRCCRALYNTALEQRKSRWERGQDRSATYYQQKAELPDLKTACAEYAEVNSQVLQDVLLRVERAFAAFFRRVQAGETLGYPRFQGGSRYTTFTYPQVGEHGGARCGLVLDRDENAAFNILLPEQQQASSRAGQARQAPTWAAGPSVA